MNSYVTHLESALDGTRFPAGQVHTVHQGRPLWVRYDLDAVRAAVTPTDLRAAPCQSVALPRTAAAAADGNRSRSAKA